MGKRKRRLRALEVKRKSAALTNTELQRKRLNLRLDESSSDNDSVTGLERVSHWVSQLRKKNSVSVRSVLKGLLKDLKNIPVKTLEEYSSTIVNAIIPRIIDPEEETRRDAVKLLGGFLERSSKPKFLPTSFISHLKIHLRHNGVSAFETGSQLINILKEHRMAYLVENVGEFLSLFTELLDDNVSQRLPFSVESSEQQFCLAIQLMESFQSLLSTLCDCSSKNLEFLDLLKNNSESEDIHVVVNDIDSAFCGLDCDDSVSSNLDIISAALVNLTGHVCRTIRSFGKYPVVTVGDRPHQKKLIVVFGRILSSISNLVYRFEFFKFSFEQCKVYLPVLFDTLRSFRLRDKAFDKLWEESFLRFAEFSCFLCRFPDCPMNGPSDCVQVIIRESIEICYDYLTNSSDKEMEKSQSFLVILASMLCHLMKQLPLDDIVPLVDAFLSYWIQADIHSQCEFSSLYLLWQVVTNQDLFCRCESMEKVFRSLLKVSWNTLRAQYIENHKVIIYFWLAAVSYIPEQYKWAYDESCCLAKSFFGKRKKESGKYSFVPGPFVLLDLKLKRVLLSLLSRSSRFPLETAEVLLVCVQHPNCIADQSSWMVFGYFLDLLKRFSTMFSLEERYYIACLVIIVVCRLSSNYPQLETQVVRIGQKCLAECRLDRNSFQNIIQILHSEKHLPVNLVEKVLCVSS